MPISTQSATAPSSNACRQSIPRRKSKMDIRKLLSSFGRQTNRPHGRGRHRRRTARPWVMERLEERALLSPGLVSSDTDDFGNTFAEASVIMLDASGSGHQEGRIEGNGDTDMFLFVAPVT